MVFSFTFTPALSVFAVGAHAAAPVELQVGSNVVGGLYTIPCDTAVRAKGARLRNITANTVVALRSCHINVPSASDSIGLQIEQETVGANVTFLIEDSTIEVKRPGDGGNYLRIRFGAVVFGHLYPNGPSGQMTNFGTGFTLRVVRSRLLPSFIGDGFHVCGILYGDRTDFAADTVLEVTDSEIKSVSHRFVYGVWFFKSSFGPQFRMAVSNSTISTVATVECCSNAMYFQEASWGSNAVVLVEDSTLVSTSINYRAAPVLLYTIGGLGTGASFTFRRTKITARSQYRVECIRSHSGTFQDLSLALDGVDCTFQGPVADGIVSGGVIIGTGWNGGALSIKDTSFTAGPGTDPQAAMLQLPSSGNTDVAVSIDKVVLNADNGKGFRTMITTSGTASTLKGTLCMSAVGWGNGTSVTWPSAFGGLRSAGGCTATATASLSPIAVIIDVGLETGGTPEAVLSLNCETIRFGVTLQNISARTTVRLRGCTIYSRAAEGVGVYIDGVVGEGSAVLIEHTLIDVFRASADRGAQGGVWVSSDSELRDGSRIVVGPGTTVRVKYSTSGMTSLKGADFGLYLQSGAVVRNGVTVDVTNTTIDVDGATPHAVFLDKVSFGERFLLRVTNHSTLRVFSTGCCADAVFLLGDGNVNCSRDARFELSGHTVVDAATTDLGAPVMIVDGLGFAPNTTIAMVDVAMTSKTTTPSASALFIRGASYDDFHIRLERVDCSVESENADATNPSGIVVFSQQGSGVEWRSGTFVVVESTLRILSGTTVSADLRFFTLPKVLGGHRPQDKVAVSVRDTEFVVPADLSATTSVWRVSHLAGALVTSTTLCLLRARFTNGTSIPAPPTDGFAETSRCGTLSVSMSLMTPAVIDVGFETGGAPQAVLHLPCHRLVNGATLRNVTDNTTVVIDGCTIDPDPGDDTIGLVVEGGLGHHSAIYVASSTIRVMRRGRGNRHFAALHITEDARLGNHSRVVVGPGSRFSAGYAPPPQGGGAKMYASAVLLDVSDAVGSDVLVKVKNSTLEATAEMRVAAFHVRPGMAAGERFRIVFTNHSTVTATSTNGGPVAGVLLEGGTYGAGVQFTLRSTTVTAACRTTTSSATAGVLLEPVPVMPSSGAKLRLLDSTIRAVGEGRSPACMFFRNGDVRLTVAMEDSRCVFLAKHFAARAGGIVATNVNSWASGGVHIRNSSIVPEEGSTRTTQSPVAFGNTLGTEDPWFSMTVADSTLDVVPAASSSPIVYFRKLNTPNPYHVAGCFVRVRRRDGSAIERPQQLSRSTVCFTDTASLTRTVSMWSTASASLPQTQSGSATVTHISSLSLPPTVTARTHTGTASAAFSATASRTSTAPPTASPRASRTMTTLHTATQATTATYTHTAELKVTPTAPLLSRTASWTVSLNRTVSATVTLIPPTPRPAPVAVPIPVPEPAQVALVGAGAVGAVVVPTAAVALQRVGGFAAPCGLEAAEMGIIENPLRVVLGEARYGDLRHYAGSVVGNVGIIVGVLGVLCLFSAFVVASPVIHHSALPAVGEVLRSGGGVAAGMCAALGCLFAGDFGAALVGILLQPLARSAFVCVVMWRHESVASPWAALGVGAAGSAVVLAIVAAVFGAAVVAPRKVAVFETRRTVAEVLQRRRTQRHIPRVDRRGTAAALELGLLDAVAMEAVDDDAGNGSDGEPEYVEDERPPMTCAELAVHLGKWFLTGSGRWRSRGATEEEEEGGTVEDPAREQSKPMGQPPAGRSPWAAPVFSVAYPFFAEYSGHGGLRYAPFFFLAECGVSITFAAAEAARTAGYCVASDYVNVAVAVLYAGTVAVVRPLHVPLLLVFAAAISGMQVVAATVALLDDETTADHLDDATDNLEAVLFVLAVVATLQGVAVTALGVMRAVGQRGHCGRGGLVTGKPPPDPFADLFDEGDAYSDDGGPTPPDDRTSIELASVRSSPPSLHIDVPAVDPGPPLIELESGPDEEDDPLAHLLGAATASDEPSLEALLGIDPTAPAPDPLQLSQSLVASEGVISLPSPAASPAPMPELEEPPTRPPPVVEAAPLTPCSSFDPEAEQSSSDEEQGDATAGGRVRSGSVGSYDGEGEPEVQQRRRRLHKRQEKVATVHSGARAELDALLRATGPSTRRSKEKKGKGKKKGRKTAE